VRAGDGYELPDAGRFSAALRECPLRYVLGDDMVRCATELAFAEGDRLSSCLDLVHVPAQSVWIEWAETPRLDALQSIPALEVKVERHGGALVTARADCRSGHIRTFWSTLSEQAYLSPFVINFDFDRTPPASPTETAVWRGDTVLCMPGEPAIEDLLTHFRFEFDNDWAMYYSGRCDTEELRTSVLRLSLGTCAFDVPMLMAFFLMLGARNLLPRQEVSLERINRSRRRAGKAPLLEHVEVSAPLDGGRTRGSAPSNESDRSSPRLHHVRGHIVRRGASVFWRSPHLRGSSRLGQVRSRTVVLSL
jgi:hypothetical protein